MSSSLGENSMEDIVGTKNNEEEKVESDRDKPGLNVFQTSCFIMGEMAGSGVVALPNALLGTGYIGVVLLVVFGLSATYCGVLLGKCWVMMEEKYDHCRQEVRQPYQEIGTKTFGNALRMVITSYLLINQIALCVAYTLLVAGMLQDLFLDIWRQSICYWEIIVVAASLPFTWFQTPKDFWVIAVGAAFSIILASLFLTIQALIDIGNPSYEDIYYPNPTFKSFSLALGAIFISCGGAAAALPTYQNDMKDRKKITLAASLGFLGTLIVYFPVAVSGYFVYGNKVSANVAQTIENVPMRITVQTLIIFHLMCALVLTANPAFQSMEDMARIKPGFITIKCGFRAIVAVFILFLGETVPNFSVILDLIGGVTCPLLVFVFPIMCYIKLVSTRPENTVGNIKRTITLHGWTLLMEISTVTGLIGIVSGLTALGVLMAPDALSKPCYVQLTPVPEHTN